MRFLALAALAVTFMELAACAGGCQTGVFTALSGGQCSQTTSNFSSKHIGSAACASIPSTRKITIECTKAGSGTNSVCSQSMGSDNANFLVILMPDTGSGVFNDSTIGTIHNCGELWAAMNSSNLPSDLAGIYYSDTTTGDGIGCPNSDVGCSHTSNNCVAGWNLSSGGGLDQPAILTAGTHLLVCAFLDTPLPGNLPPAGAPPAPGSGVLSTSVSTAFGHVQVGVNIDLPTWVNY